MTLEPGGVFMWLIVGLIAGWLAGKFEKGSGFGLVGDIVIGIMGAFLGGLVFGVIAPGTSVGFIGSIIVAFVGSILLIGLLRMLSGARPGLGRSLRH
jgi:uncharacterized membrane protein YeaQ/YmgE (transglycosylase-associated protein family)